MTKRRNIVPLRASTLPEMLVVILLSAVVLGAVSDGLGLFRRYAALQTGRIAASQHFRESYYRLEYLTSSSDSLVINEGRVTVWCGGDPGTVFYQRDSLLLALVARQTDTLFSGVASFEVCSPQAGLPPDSLVLTLVRSDGPLRIALPIIVREYVRVQQDIEETEHAYEYE